MREFKHGILIEDGIVHFRRTDLILAKGLAGCQTWGSLALNGELFKDGSISAEDALKRLKELKADILEQFDFYETYFTNAKIVTPEWIDENIGRRGL